MQERFKDINQLLFIIPLNKDNYLNYLKKSTVNTSKFGQSVSLNLELLQLFNHIYDNNLDDVYVETCRLL